MLVICGKMVVTRWKIDKYVLISSRMSRRAFSNTSGDVLEIELLKMVRKFYKCTITNMVTQGNQW